MNNFPKFDTDAEFAAVICALLDQHNAEGAGTVNEVLRPQFCACCAKEKTYIAAMDTTPWMSNPWGFLHGGIIASFFDECMGVGAFCFNGQRTTQTLSMETAYLRPGVIGQRLLVRARLAKSGRSLQYLTAEAWSEGDPKKLVATSTGVYFASGDKVELK